MLILKHDKESATWKNDEIWIDREAFQGRSKVYMEMVVFRDVLIFIPMVELACIEESKQFAVRLSLTVVDLETASQDRTGNTLFHFLLVSNVRSVQEVQMKVSEVGELAGEMKRCAEPLLQMMRRKFAEIYGPFVKEILYEGLDPALLLSEWEAENSVAGAMLHRKSVYNEKSKQLFVITVYAGPTEKDIKLFKIVIYEPETSKEHTFVADLDTVYPKQGLPRPIQSSH